MADSLDDFFAKKDKKRGKDKGKAALSAEALVKELEEGSRQAEYPVRKDVKTAAAIELLGLDADDADWRDFEDVEKRDYTGLKVKEMSLQDQNEEEQRRLMAEQIEQAPESTPWKIKDDPAGAVAATTAPEPTSNAKQPAEPMAPEPTKNDSAASDPTAEPGEKSKENVDSSEKKSDKPSAKYVPPGQRNNDVKQLDPVRLSQLKTSGTSRSGNAHLNIQDEQAFPSLG